MATEKTAEELLNEAEELQKKAVPELYKDDEEGTSGEGVSGEPAAKVAPASSEEVIETEEEKKAREDAEATEKAKLAEPDYKADVLRLNAEIKKLNDYESSARGRLQLSAEENKTLKERLETLAREVEALKTPIDKGVDTSNLTEEQLIEELGEKAGKLVYLVNIRNTQLEKMMQDLNGKIETFSEKTVKTEGERFLNNLTDSVNDWETIRENPEFHEFLQKPVSEFSDRTVLNELSEAANSLNAKKTAKIYQAFKDSKAIADNGGIPPLKKDKEKLLAPGTTPKGEKTEKTIKTFSLAEVEAMTKKINRLQGKGNFDAAKKIQAELDAFTDSLG